jgi:DNA replicative helicase MCM subunit Mcm2 (Cdc46/Mcm family)
MGILHHGPEFDQAEILTVTSHPRLEEKDPSTGIQSDDQGYGQKNRGKKNQGDERDEDIKQAVHGSKGRETVLDITEYLGIFVEYKRFKNYHMDIQQLVLETLKGSKEAMKAGEIAVKAGVEKAEVDKAIKALKKAEKIISPKNCYYQAK